MKLYIVRHGETKWNKLGLMQGHMDIPLSEFGKLQARNLKKDIANLSIDVCLSSPLSRAFETAFIIVDDKIPIIKWDKLKERFLGDYEGKEIDYELIGKTWDFSLDYSVGNIEVMSDVLKRAKAVLDEIKKDYDGKNVLIVSHGAFIKALHFNIIGYDQNTDFLSFKPKNATIYEYDI